MSTTTEPPAIAVRLLGTFSLTIDDTEVTRFRAGKARNLFQYLVVRRGQVVLSDKLQYVLWPDDDVSSSSLKVAVHALRQILDARADGTGDRGIRIVREDFGYALRADHIWVDVERFESLVQDGVAADQSGDHDSALALYARAMEHYRGDFLAGEAQDWVVEHREWCRALALRALERLATDAAARADTDAVARWCRSMIEFDPYFEPAYRLLIEAHGRLGELGSVHRWYDLCVRRLRDHLDVTPGADLEHAYDRAMMAGDRAPAAPAGAARRGRLAAVAPGTSALPGRTG